MQGGEGPRISLMDAGCASARGIVVPAGSSRRRRRFPVASDQQGRPSRHARKGGTSSNGDHFRNQKGIQVNAERRSLSRVRAVVGAPQVGVHNAFAATGSTATAVPLSDVALASSPGGRTSCPKEAAV